MGGCAHWRGRRAEQALDVSRILYSIRTVLRSDLRTSRPSHAINNCSINGLITFNLVAFGFARETRFDARLSADPLSESILDVDSRNSRLRPSRVSSRTARSLSQGNPKGNPQGTPEEPPKDSPLDASLHCNKSAPYFLSPLSLPTTFSRPQVRSASVC